MRRRLQLRLTTLELLALATDAEERVLLRAEPWILRAKSGRASEKHREYEQRGSRARSSDRSHCRTDRGHMLLRCLPIDTALPASPISAPEARPRNAMRDVKKTVSNCRYRSRACLAT